MGSRSSRMIVTITLLLFSFALLLGPPPRADSAPISSEFLRPDFTASNFRFIDSSGTFLASRGGAFQAALTNTLHTQLNLFYFAVVHVDSNTIVWSANRNSSISSSASLRLTAGGLFITDEQGNPVWSTPPLSSPVSLLQLLDSGNLVLLDKSNGSLWQSFEHPTDTILIGQQLPVGQSLVSSLNNQNLSAGDYQLTVTGGDAMMLWNGLIYWKLSMEPKAYWDSNLPASFMALNGSGLYIFGANGSTVVIQLVLGVYDFQLAKLESNGRFTVRSFHNHSWVDEFSGPVDDCRIPNICGSIELCSTGQCSCPPGFRNSDSQTMGGCTPSDSSYSFPSACAAAISTNGSEVLNSSISYMKLPNGTDYFSNDFTEPVVQGVSLSVCENQCSQNCSCLGIFHDSSSGSCHLLQNHLGSFISSSTTQTDRRGYIRAMLVSSNRDRRRNRSIGRLVALPSFGFFVVMILTIGVIWYRRKLRRGIALGRLGRRDLFSSTELELISIPGLPVRFDYEELVAATDNFKTQIGFGGFGTVYKGILPDKTVVAVKKITSLGMEGRKEFCTEIAIIGNTHHVNLVRLKGFCAQRRQWFLVMDYMNKGSLDRILFNNGVPVLDWQERYNIALATARGLAYLHSACEQKIIHCDVKPENILLDDNLHVKISDFGLSKLLSPEQSGLFTTMRGTRGYLGPEWLSNSAISDKSDVYSYGMVVLEIVRGRKNCSIQPRSDSTEHVSSSRNSQTSHSSYFPLFALEMHEQRRYLELADPRLEGRVTSGEVETLVRVALCCVHEEPTLRPSMVNVVGMLEGVLPLGEPRAELLNFLRFFGRAFEAPSTVDPYNEQNDLLRYYPQAVGFNSSSSGSFSSFSYLSSQQVSGPR